MIMTVFWHFQILAAHDRAGEGWAQAHIRHLHDLGLDAYIVDESRPFRFGAGPKIASKYSVVIPLHVPQASKTPWMRISIVDQDVPLLLSKSALKALGAKLDLGAAKVELSELNTSMELVESSGLRGFVINRAVATAEAVYSFPPVSMLDGETEVAMGVDTWPDSSDQEPNTVHVCPQVSGIVQTAKYWLNNCWKPKLLSMRVSRSWWRCCLISIRIGRGQSMVAPQKGDAVSWLVSGLTEGSLGLQRLLKSSQPPFDTLTCSCEKGVSFSIGHPLSF